MIWKAQAQYDIAAADLCVTSARTEPFGRTILAVAVVAPRKGAMFRAIERRSLHLARVLRRIARRG